MVGQALQSIIAAPTALRTSQTCTLCLCTTALLFDAYVLHRVRPCESRCIISDVRLDNSRNEGLNWSSGEDLFEF